MTTSEAAEIMLESGGCFTAATLGYKLNISAKEASGLLYNIRTGKKYVTVETDLPNRTVKVVSISGRKVSENNLWRVALGLSTASA
ncbi:hypothetical protein CWB65_14685 [Pseudoalteromonas sp. S554]|nr:hypothetical protein CWB65_14685 [Pseudoalteromonas sp. S554]